MGSSQLKASIKKIEIINKAMKEEWQQSIRVILGDIELNNDNLIQLRQFRPDEAVNVSFESIQLQLFDVNQQQHHKVTKETNNDHQTDDAQVIGEEERVNRPLKDSQGPFSIEDGDIPLGEHDVVEKEFKF